MIAVTKDVFDAIAAHALRCRPLEACGMASTTAADGVVDGFDQVVNVAASPTRFELDPAEMLAVESQIDERGRQLVGIVHSHVDSSPYPSATDIADAARYDPSGSLVQLIVSLRGAQPELRAYRVGNGTVTELRVEIAAANLVGSDDDQALAVVSQLPRRVD